MIKKSVDDAVLDAVLAKAFEEAAERDLAEMETDPEAARRYPEAYKKIERKRYNQVKRRGISARSGGSFVPVMKRVVSFVLIIGFVGCCLMLSAPKIRAEFSGMITSFLKKCFSITVPSNVTTYETDNYLFGYIPESFKATETFDESFISTYRFTSAQTDYYFDVRIYSGTNTISQNDSEYTGAREVSVNEHIGYMIESEDDIKNRIVWTDNFNLYYVSGNISSSELMKIAENISVKMGN